MRLLVALALLASCHSGTGPESDALMRGFDAHGPGDAGMHDAGHDAHHDAPIDAGSGAGSDAGVPVDAMPDAP